VRQPVFADVDTGVDDAMALVYLLASADAELIGIACTGGNVDVDQVCRNNLGLLELCGATRVPVSRGAGQPLTAALRTAEDTHGPAGMGYAELPSATQELTSYDAAEAWIRAARAHPGELVALASGPLTNLALALRAEPDLPGLLGRLVIMGGSFDYRGNTTPVAEWNTSVDPEAAAEVFDAWGRAAQAKSIAPENLPIVCGLNLTESVMLTPEIMQRLAQAVGSTAAVNPLMRVLEDSMRFYFEFHFSQGEGYLAHLHDPLAAAVALDPGLIRTRSATVAVELNGMLTRGMTVADWHGRWGRVPNARVGVEVDPDVFFTRFIQRVGPFARRLTHS
jgi:purine nucleosidase